MDVRFNDKVTDDYGESSFIEQNPVCRGFG